MTVFVFLGSLLAAMAIGIPIAYSLLLSGVALMVHLDLFDAQILAQNVVNGADSFPLLAVPFFMLAGEIMNEGGLSRRIVNLALTLVGHHRGGLGFVAIPTVDQHPAAIAGLHWFGIVQYVGCDRLDDWTEFYRELFAFDALPDSERFGILPSGRILRSPCRTFYLQLIEPEGGVVDTILAAAGEETLQRMGLGTPDVPAAVSALRARGVEFVESPGLHTEDRGAPTQRWLRGVMFELVQDKG